MPEQIGILGGAFIRELSLGLSSSIGTTGAPLGGTVNLSIFPNLTGISASNNGITVLTGISTSAAPHLQKLRFENNYLTKENLEDVVTGIYANRNSITGAANKIVDFNLVGDQMGTIDRTIRINNVNKYQAEIDKLDFNVDYLVNGYADQSWINGAPGTPTQNPAFSSGVNWTNGLVPVNYDAIYFTDPIGPNRAFNDLPTDTQFNGIIFDLGSRAITITGNRFILTYSGIVNNTSRTQTVRNDIILSGARRGVNCNSGPIVLGGNIGGSGNFTKFGTGVLSLSGNNSYTGDTFIRNGTVSVFNSNTFGTGNVYLQTPAPEFAPAFTIQQTAIPSTVVINNPIYLSYVSGTNTVGFRTYKSTTFNSPIIFTSGGSPATPNQNSIINFMVSGLTGIFNGGISGTPTWTSVLVTLQSQVAAGSTVIFSGSPVFFNSSANNFTLTNMRPAIIAVTGNRFQTLRLLNSDIRCDVPFAINNDNISFGGSESINLNGNGQIFRSMINGGTGCNIFNNSSNVANLTINPANATNSIYNGSISGNINLIKTNQFSTLTLSGVRALNIGPTYTGSTTITGGILVNRLPFSDPYERITSGVFSAGTSLIVGFSSSPASGESFQLFGGPTVNNYSVITLQGSAAGRTATYDSASSTLTLTN
jgi:autotransporter-associated beta strand protein